MFGVGYGPANHYGGQAVSLTVRGAQSRDAELACENENGRGCVTLTTEEVLRLLEPVVKKPKQSQPQEGQPPQ